MSFKKIWNFMTSMKFAVILLVVLAAACTAGSLVTQGQTLSWYASRYSERTAALIMALHLDDAFHSWWFVLINVFLCLDLIFCNLIRLPGLLKRIRAYKKLPVPVPDGGKEPGTAGEYPGFEVLAEGIRDPEKLFGKLSMPSPQKTEDGSGRPVLFSVKNTAGFWGAWICHLGILFIIMGFSLGQMTKQEYTVYGVPGDTLAIGETGYTLHVNDFTVTLRDDDTVEQYTADITVTEPVTGRQERDTVSVNDPAKLFGMSFYQNSTGWAAGIDITKDGEPLQDGIIYAGSFVAVADKPELVIYLNAFYPDYEMVPGQGPSTKSGKLLNPGYLYSVYYRGEILGMNALMQDEELTIDEYTVTFADPQSYTLIQIKKDRFIWLVFAGGLTTVAGLILAFYIRTCRVLAVQNEGPDPDRTWTAYGSSVKGGFIFREEFAAAVKEISAPGYAKGEGQS